MSVSATILIVEFLIIGVQTVVWGALFFYPDNATAQCALINYLKSHTEYLTIASFFSLALIYSIGMIVDASTAFLEDEIKGAYRGIRKQLLGTTIEECLGIISFLIILVVIAGLLVLDFEPQIIILVTLVSLIGILRSVRIKEKDDDGSKKVVILLEHPDAYSEVMKMEFQSRLLRSSLFNYAALLIVMYYKHYISFNATNITISLFIYAFLYKAYRRRSGVYVKKKGQIISELGRTCTKQRPDINHS